MSERSYEDIQRAVRRQRQWWRHLVPRLRVLRIGRPDGPREISILWLGSIWEIW